MFAVFAVFASAGVVFAFLFKEVRPPLESLSNGAPAASGNLTRGYRTKDEVEALGRQFNIMAERLKGFYEGLNKR